MIIEGDMGREEKRDRRQGVDRVRNEDEVWPCRIESDRDTETETDKEGEARQGEVESSGEGATVVQGYGARSRRKGKDDVCQSS